MEVRVGQNKKIGTIRIGGRGSIEGMLFIDESERLGRQGLGRGGKTIKQFLVGGREGFLETKRDECSGVVSLRS